MICPVQRFNVFARMFYVGVGEGSGQPLAADSNVIVQHLGLTGRQGILQGSGRSSAVCWAGVASQWLATSAGVASSRRWFGRMPALGRCR